MISLLNRAAVGWAVSCSAFGLLLFFLKRAAVGWAVFCSAFDFFLFFFVSYSAFGLLLTAQPQACAGLVLHGFFFF